MMHGDAVVIDFSNHKNIENVWVERERTNGEELGYCQMDQLFQWIHVGGQYMGSMQEDG